MNLTFIYSIFQTFVNNFFNTAEIIGPKIIAASLILIIGWFVSYGLYRLVIYIFHRLKILDFIDRLWEGFEEHTSSIVDKNTNTNPEKLHKEEKKKKVRYDRISAKAISYYVFLLFFRWAIIIIGITEVERFMQDLINYLPSLFVGIMIGFFGMRFANSVHDIIYQTMELTKQETSKIIAMGAKIIIMFFTLMIMLNYIKIVDEFIINALFLGFITTLTIWVGLAFGLWGRDIAREILESFRK